MMLFILTVHELRGWVEMVNNIHGNEPMPEYVKHMYSYGDIISIKE